MTIEKAKSTDGNELTELTLRSKSHWNYSKEQIDKWKKDLTVTSSYIDEKEVYKLISNDTVIGYYSYYGLNDKEVKLENLFIEPRYIGKNYGRLLMSDFIKRATKMGFDKVILDADPNAEKFYSNLGFRMIGKLKTSIKNRFLPIMELHIKSAHKDVYKK